MSAVLADMRPGFRDPVHGAQQAFRSLLSAMSRPGRIVRLPADVTRGLVSPAPQAFGAAAAAVLLSLLDAETTAMLIGPCATTASSAWLRFHTGVRLCATVETAGYVLARSRDLDPDGLTKLSLGTDEAPQAGATLIVEVGGLGGLDDEPDATRLVLRGPGVDGEGRLSIAGLSRDFWDWRIALHAELPRGIDLILVCGDRLAALPRTTRIAIDGSPACT